jgi:hypothetical protein
MSKRRAERSEAAPAAESAPGGTSETIKPKNKKPASALHGFGAALAVMTSLPAAAPAVAPARKPAAAKAGAASEKTAAAADTQSSSLSAQARAILAEKAAKHQERRNAKAAAAAAAGAPESGPTPASAEAPALSAKLKKRLTQPQASRTTPDGASALAEAKARARERSRRRQKKLLLAKDHVGAGFSELERKLLRVATKGVVTLFNVVAKQQRELQAVEAAGDLHASSKDKRAAAISQAGFVDMLRASTKTAAAGVGADKKGANAGGSDDDDDDDDTAAGLPRGGSSAEAAAAAATAKAQKGLAWKALDEGYLLGKNKMKDWEATDSSEESSD